MALPFVYYCCETRGESVCKNGAKGLYQVPISEILHVSLYGVATVMQWDTSGSLTTIVCSIISSKSFLPWPSQDLNTNFGYTCTGTLHFLGHDSIEDHGFFQRVHCDLELGDMTWVEIMTHPWTMDSNCAKDYPDPHLMSRQDTPLGNRKQLCEILSRLNMQYGVMAQGWILAMCVL